MPSPPFSSNFWPSGGRRGQSSGDPQERLIPFPVLARSNADPEPSTRRRRDPHDLERPPAQRRGRRHRQRSAPWLQRNALSIAAVSVLAAVLGLGFGLLQTINRPEPVPALLASGGQPDSAGTPVSAGSAAGAAAPALGSASPNASNAAPAAEAPREIQAAARVLQPTYTVQSGDTLGKIATQFGTSVERIQALNNLADPRVLRIGTKLVIPPPF
ncbi:MAG: LysM peptidoglycan-binding domain-containing protein [Chloroflexota bacterium]